mgnify:CR=1 FL=1
MRDNNAERKPQNDQIGISHLFDEINNMKSEISEVKQKLNNGVLESTKENTKSIDKLGNKFENLSKEIEELSKNFKCEQNYQEGKSDTFKLLVAISSSVIGSVVGTIKVLQYIGALGG